MKFQALTEFTTGERMNVRNLIAALVVSCLLVACGGGGGGGDSSSGSSSTTAAVAGGTASTPAALSLSMENAISSDISQNYFKYNAVAGERLVIRVNLDSPLVGSQYAACIMNGGSGSYGMKIYVYSAKLVQLDNVCGEDLTYTFSESGTYIFAFDFSLKGAGVFHAASLVGKAPVQFLATGAGTPVSPKKLSTTSSNPTVSDVFYNYYWIAVNQGDTVVVNAVLDDPLTASEKTACIMNEGSDSNRMQIIAYDSQMNKVWNVCGESGQFVAPASGNYTFLFHYGSRSRGGAKASVVSG